MDFQFSNSSCVLVGSFNIYIFQPEWMVAKNLIQSESFEISGDLKRAGHQISVKDEGLIWTVRPEGLTIQSTKSTADCGFLVSKVIDLLPNTPFFAIGNNVQFEAVLSQGSDLIERLFGKESATIQGRTAKQRTWHRSFELNGRTTNIQLSAKADKASLSINTHTELASQDSSVAMKRAGDFRDDIFSGVKLANEILGLSIKYEHNNNAA